jgi:hypothetical protein
MSARQPNPRRVKLHRPYTVEELALALGLHKNTVRRWTACGLQPIDDQRPMMVRGVDVVEFLQKRRAGRKRPCSPGQMYCFKCRVPKAPAGSMADMEVVGSTAGQLVGICPTCGTMMYRRVNPARIAQVRGNLDITIRQKKHA